MNDNNTAKREKNTELIRRLRLPKFHQIGIVLQSVNDTIRYYSDTFGMGPWFRPSFSEQMHNFQGNKRTHYDVELALHFSNGIQLELIEPKEGDENIHMNYLEEHGEGIHHMGFFVSDIERRLEAIEEMGIGVIQSGYLVSSGKAGGSVTTYAYLDTAEIGGIVFELIQTKFVGINIKMSRFWLELGNITGDVEKIKS